MFLMALVCCFLNRILNETKGTIDEILMVGDLDLIPLICLFGSVSILLECRVKGCIE